MTSRIEGLEERLDTFASKYYAWLRDSLNPAKRERYEAARTSLLLYVGELERDAAAKQAHIDRLMLEYCPDEMTSEQTEEWKRHQRVAQE